MSCGLHFLVVVCLADPADCRSWKAFCAFSTLHAAISHTYFDRSVKDLPFRSLRRSWGSVCNTGVIMPLTNLQKQSHNNPSHLVTHPLHRKARQDKAGRNRGSTHIHARTTHHQYMWACGITKIESCRSWVPYMRSSPPAASVAASRWRGHGMDRRQTPPCTWACNITDLHRGVSFDFDCGLMPTHHVV
jgi:hypothetical protein